MIVRKGCAQFSNPKLIIFDLDCFLRWYLHVGEGFEGFLKSVRKGQLFDQEAI